ncbi:MAG: hypothetical protein AB7D37_06470 [Desulfovibrio sp.]
MKRRVIACCCLLAAVLPLGAGCDKKATPPAMPQLVNPQPGPGASPQEVERYQLEEEKRTLVDNYGDNIDRIQQINARLIQLNMEIHNQAHQ